MPEKETIFGKFDPAHPRTNLRLEFIGDEVYEEREIDLSPYKDIELDEFVKQLYARAEGMDNPKLTRHENWDYYDDHCSVSYTLWHIRPATELELQIANEHRAKEAAKAKKSVEAQKKRAEATERKQYEKLKKKYEKPAT